MPYDEAGRIPHHSNTTSQHREHDNEAGPCGHQPSAADVPHHHPGQCERRSEKLSPREKLIVRLEHAIHHNNEHSRLYQRLADEAGDIGNTAAAHDILEVSRLALLQNEYMQRALARIQSS